MPSPPSPPPLEASATASKTTLTQLRALDRYTARPGLPSGTIDENLAKAWLAYCGPGPGHPPRPLLPAAPLLPLVANCRLFAYAAGQDPRHAQLCRRVPDIPLKKTTPDSMTYLNQDEVKALLAAPPARHRLGLRGRALLTLPCNTGARAAEVAQLNIKDLRLQTPSQVRIPGKGRKERICPRGRRPRTHSAAISANGQTAPSQTRHCS